MKSKKLEALTNKLLDTGKRNNLINFKDSKSSSLEVVYPHTENVFSKIESSFTFEVYDPKLQIDERDSCESNQNVTLSEEEMSLGEEKRAKYINEYSKKIKKQSQILLYNNDSSALAVLKKIDKKVRTTIEETGINAAYMAFGFIRWKDQKYSQYTYDAPILLAPVSFKNDSAITPYYIQMSEDDIIVNPTFSYKLNAEYGVSLPDYSEGSLSDYLVQVQEIINKINPEWKTINSCKIGFFSFLKLNMYEDLINNEEKILDNTNVRMILGESPLQEAQSCLDNNLKTIRNELIELHNVVDADSSQIEAIEMAKAGKSFVLQGPPGTGKSQTITNIITECLSDGKKVLFVSEKMAALEVVYDKLKKADLDEFCLELHSYKANKKAFIEQLMDTLHTPKTAVSNKAENEIKKKIIAQEELDNYEAELHKQRDVIDKSLYELYEAYSSCRKTTEIDYLIPEINKKGKEYLDSICKLLEQYPEYVKSIGNDYKNNFWYGYIGKNSTYESTTKVKIRLQKTVKSLEKVIPLAEKISKRYKVNIKSLEELNIWKNIFAILSSSEILSPSLLNAQNLNSIYPSISKMADMADSITESKKYLDSLYEKDIFSLDGELGYKLLSREFTNPLTRVFNSQYKKIISDLRIAKIDGEKIDYTTALEVYRQLNNYQKNIKSFEIAENQVKNFLGKKYNGLDTNWKKAIYQLSLIKDFLSDGYDFGVLLPSVTVEIYEKERKTFGEICKWFIDNMTETEDAILSLQEEFDKSVISIEDNKLSDVYSKLKSCLDNFDMLENWIRFSSLLENLKKSNLDKMVDVCISSGIPAEEVVTAYKKTFYKQWIDYIIHENGNVLLNFNRITHDNAVKTFKEKDNIQLDINKVIVKQILSRKRPSLDFISPGSELSIIVRESEKKRKQKSIRQLLLEAGKLIQEIKPLFLMSPLSVSTYLATSDVNFDVVVFDEASQIFPQDAIGAIYRAKQVICVGDTKQMPPTDFFTSAIDSDESDEEQEDVNDFESILDICSTSLPQRRLRWHYRSRYEELIAFSNKEFYQNQLITFPSSIVNQNGVGVDFHYVEGGTFDHKSHNNRVEAEYIVDLIFDNIRKYPDRSLGVVAFSISQQNLIERLLERKRQSEPSHEDFFGKDKPEPFFVKNLETVQGDERDTIIFSFAYGKDTQGRMMYFFGPINREGGERRLNVAVTRAKYNIQFVASIHCTDIDLSHSSAKGVELMRAYLDYAEHGAVALERSLKVNSFEEFDSEFEMEVHDFLIENGFDVDTQVGCSSFRIDMALKKPHSSEYVLAIECDGATYHNSKNARDRDRLRQEVLERMGWKFYRIWSTDWFRNNTVEKKSLLEACAKALSNADMTSMSASNSLSSDINSNVYEEEIAPRHLKFPVYRKVDEDKLMSSGLKDIEIISKIAEIEAPISEEWLLKRIVKIFGRSKVSKAVQEEYEKLTKDLDNYGLKRRNGFIYLAETKKYFLRVPDHSCRRELKFIAPEELATGMLIFIKQNISVERYGLYQAVAKELGFSRIGENIYGHLDTALNLIKSLVDIDGDMITLKSEIKNR